MRCQTGLLILRRSVLKRPFKLHLDIAHRSSSHIVAKVIVSGIQKNSLVCGFCTTGTGIQNVTTGETATATGTGTVKELTSTDIIIIDRAVQRGDLFTMLRLIEHVAFNQDGKNRID